jgi:hypothetical protein
MKALIPQVYFRKIPENFLHFGISFALFSLTFLIAFFFDNLTTVWEDILMLLSTISL